MSATAAADPLDDPAGGALDIVRVAGLRGVRGRELGGNRLAQDQRAGRPQHGDRGGVHRRPGCPDRSASRGSSAYRRCRRCPSRPPARRGAVRAAARHRSRAPGRARIRDRDIPRRARRARVPATRNMQSATTASQVVSPASIRRATSLAVSSFSPAIGRLPPRPSSRLHGVAIMRILRPRGPDRASSERFGRCNREFQGFGPFPPPPASRRYSSGRRRPRRPGIFPGNPPRSIRPRKARRSALPVRPVGRASPTWTTSGRL